MSPASIVISLLLGCLMCCAASFGDERETSPLLMEPADVEAVLGSPGLRLIDVRDEEDYEQAHIPGAVRVSVGQWKELAIAPGGLRDTDGWSNKVGSLGISDDSRVVVYGGSVGNAARIWWLLKYVGVPSVSLLNGGWDQWVSESRETESGTPEIAATPFTPDFQHDRVAELDAVKSSLGTNQFLILDTRSDGEFNEGRIPGSLQLEWKHLINEDGRFKSKDQLDSLFREHGIHPTHVTVCY